VSLQATVKRMPPFRILVRGSGLWISLDDEMQRVEFSVHRILDSTDAETAARQALALVRQDPKAQPLPGYPRPTLTVDEVAPADAVPAVQPGFAFYPDAD
jgi:hypothetical protein